jgi:rhomboid protease GluP
MLIEFTQKHVEALPVDDLTSEQFLSMAIEVSRSLGWVFSSIITTGFIAHTNNGIFAWNAEVRLKVNSEAASIQSQSRGNSIIEFGKNKENLQFFISAFNEVKKNRFPEIFKLKYADFQPSSA